MSYTPVPIIVGATYLYTCTKPNGCEGMRYRLHREIRDVPCYQPKLLLEALVGKDKGLWFTISLRNFSTRYVLHERRKGKSK